MRLRQKVVLITGASSGLGRVVAEQLGRRGNDIAIVARRRSLLDQVAEQIEASGSRAQVLDGDALDPAFARHAVDLVVRQWGRIDACLLNIGHGPTQAIDQIDADAAARIMRLNYDTLLHFFFPVAEQMKRQATGGLIAHTNSLAGYLGIPLQGPYCAAKAAGRMFMETAGIELRPHGIRTATLSPGFIATGTGHDQELSRPLELSMEQAAQAIIDGMEREATEARFPRRLGALVGLARVLPRSVREAALRRLLG